MTEEWRKVEQCPAYSVSSVGRVRRDSPGKSTRIGRILKGNVIHNGYRRIELRVDGASRRFLVHVLVAIAFLPNRGSGYQVNHIDGDKLNNRAENLEFVTASQNILHSIEIGIHPVGMARPNAKLSESDVQRIRSRETSTRDLSRELGVSRSTIMEIIRRTSWRHIA